MGISTRFNLRIVVCLLITFASSNRLFGQSPPAPVIRLPFNESSGLDVANTGTVSATFSRSSTTIPAISTNVPAGVGGTNSIDFGTATGNNFVESVAVIDPLKNLSAFTITGWVNNRSSTTGSGGNRIVSWINSGGDGVDLVYQSNGSLRLGVDGWPDNSPAFSSASKVTTNASATAANWVFFAVTYQSNGQVQFYFGNNTVDAALDVTRSYPGPGVTGSNINKLAIGAFNAGTRNASTYDRMFRGLIDNIQIHNSVLSAADITSVQRASTIDSTPPSAPTNLTWLSKTSTTVSLTWTAATDNVGVTGYEVFLNQGTTTVTSSIGAVTSYTLTNLAPATVYNIWLKARDAAGNLSDVSIGTQVTSEASGAEGLETPPLIWLPLNESAVTSNTLYSQQATGSLLVQFLKPFGLPSTNVPVNVGGSNSIDLGITPVNRFVESAEIIPQLKNLSAFTLTGWLNCRSNTTGSGGNRVISWINNGGDGVDLVYQSDGSLRLGVDGWPDNSPAFSSPGKVPASAQAPASNWVFFAVTYQSNGQVQFYFGNNATDAALDVTRTYSAPGVTGSNIGKLSIGAFNDATRNANTYDRMFRGLIDDVRIHTKILGPQNIVDIQRRGTLDRTPPTVPGNLTLGSKSNTTVGLQWLASTDYYGVVAYDFFNGNTLVATTGPATVPVAAMAYVVTGLSPGQSYVLTVKARDAAGNYSAASNAVNVTTDPSSFLEPLIHLAMNDAPGEPVTNNGVVGDVFGSPPPGLTTNVPANVGGPYAFDFSDGAAFSQSNSETIGQLKGLSAFTLTGWLNARSPGTIISWLSEFDEGVYLKTNSNGELLLTVDDDIIAATPAISSSGKIPIDAANGASNWVFFAVTYQSNGQVKFYFGNNTNDALPDLTQAYPAPGVTGSNINKFMLGGWATTDGVAGYSRQYDGYMDDIQVFNSALSQTDIVHLQRQTVDQVLPTPPTNIVVTEPTTTSVKISWTAATDNEGIAGYEVRGRYSNQLITTIPGNVTTFTLTGLSAATQYDLTLSAHDANFNSASTIFTARTAVIGQQPLIGLDFDENDGIAPTNTGTLPATFVRSAGTPVSTPNTPSFNGGNAFDFDITPGNFYIESSNVIDGLKNLSAFTITGWLNNRSAITGSGGNRVVSWINNGGEGVDLVYQNNGSLRLGVDGWPDSSPAFSSANKVPTDNTTPRENWIFFAVTYQSSGQVQFYFGNTATDAALDVTRTYSGPGITGAAINKLAVGAFNSASRNASTYDRMFRGVIDEIKIFGTVLTPQEIVATQNGVSSGVGRENVSVQDEKPAIVQNETELSTELFQNYPNPYSTETEIALSLPQSIRVARINVNDITGRSLKSIEILERGNVRIKVPSDGMNDGIYMYSLMTDGKIVGVKRMMVRK